MSHELPPCDHDECPPSHCKRPGSSAAPFANRQRVDLAEWDKYQPPWDRMGDCIVINQENGPDCCESGWMVTVMAKDGATKRLDSHWMTPHEKAER